MNLYEAGALVIFVVGLIAGFGLGISCPFFRQWKNTLSAPRRSRR